MGLAMLRRRVARLEKSAALYGSKAQAARRNAERQKQRAQAELDRLKRDGFMDFAQLMDTADTHYLRERARAYAEKFIGDRGRPEYSVVFLAFVHGFRFAQRHPDGTLRKPEDIAGGND